MTGAEQARVIERTVQRCMDDIVENDIERWVRHETMAILTQQAPNLIATYLNRGWRRMVRIGKWEVLIRRV